MPKKIRKISQKVGLPPGTLVHTGEIRNQFPTVTVVDYDDKNFSVENSLVIKDALCMKNHAKYRWINLDGIHDTNIINSIGSFYGIHPLVLEDIQNTGQRPKVEEYDGYLYIVIRMIYYDNKLSEITTEQVSIILGRDYLLTFQENKDNFFIPLVDRIAKGISNIRKMGMDYLLYAIMDLIVDSYFLVLEKTGEEIELSEDSMVATPGQEMLRKVHGLKREMLYMHKAVWPLREVVGGLQRRECHLISDTTSIYLRDVYDHIIQMMDTIETYRDILSGIVDLYLSVASNKMNEVMKFLTVFSVLFMPLTFIAGVYGMNFENMPELKFKYGYFLVLAAMSICFVSMILFFRKKKWL
ncbi:MAG TPA: magnesium/cobalt transporter CorA [Pseudobacteroides sp.]|uniref:magnesium/cobalt transporter CorA n=1 Tax=Pseudobacteroides sp. TaxID=1968840 RepID=UPI002F9205AD